MKPTKKQLRLQEYKDYAEMQFILGDLERLAGITDRVKFWEQFPSGYDSVSAAIALRLGADRLKDMIVARLQSGEITLPMREKQGVKS